MSEFSKGELQLMFQRIEEKLDDINRNMTFQNARYDVEIKQIKDDVENLKNFQTKAMAIWGIATVVVGFILNKYL